MPEFGVTGDGKSGLQIEDTMDRRFGAMRKLIFEPAALQDHEEGALLRRLGALILDNDSLERMRAAESMAIAKAARKCARR